MSEDPLSTGLATFATILNEIKEASIEMMRIHPAVALLMTNLLGNIGYTIFAVKDEKGYYQLGQWGLLAGISERKFDDHQELMSYCFRSTAVHAAKLLDAQVIGEMSQIFNVSKVLKAIK